MKRIGVLLGSIPGGDAAVEDWIRQLTYNIAIGNNDAHAKNVSLMHLPHGTELSQIYDALPNLFQDGLVSWNLALAIDGHFDQRKISIERILAEIRSWSAISDSRAVTIVTGTLTALKNALNEITAPAEVSPGMIDHLHWNTSRLLSGNEISKPKR